MKHIHLFWIKLFGHSTRFSLDLNSWFELYYIYLHGNHQIRQSIQIGILEIETIKLDTSKAKTGAWSWSLCDGKEIFISEDNKDFWSE